MANSLDGRVTKLERKAADPERKIIVLYPGDPEPPEAGDPNVVVLRVVYADESTKTT